MSNFWVAGFVRIQKGLIVPNKKLDALEVLRLLLQSEARD